MAAYGVQESDDIYDKPKDVLEDDGFNLPLNFYYEALNSERNMFASDGIGAMVAYESALLGVEGWCRHLHSVPHPHPPARSTLPLPLSRSRFRSPAPAPAPALPLSPVSSQRLFVTHTHPSNVTSSVTPQQRATPPTLNRLPEPTSPSSGLQDQALQERDEQLWPQSGRDAVCLAADRAALPLPQRGRPQGAIVSIVAKISI